MTALVDFAAAGSHGFGPVRHAFGTAIHILKADTEAQVRQVLDSVHRHAIDGRWCVGYVRYEAARAFDLAMAVHPADGPLAWFAVYDEALPWPDDCSDAQDRPLQLSWQTRLSRPQFDQAIATIREAIQRGEVYQVNFTAPVTASHPWDAERDRVQDSLDLFKALLHAQPGAYAAWINTGDEQLASVSPELFFSWDGRHILARPMKGTAARAATREADEAAAHALRTSDKERAENVMIVDLLRNDLSRIAEPFSVHVKNLFEVRAWPTVWQMTSDVEARTRADLTLGDVFAALFPCGSVTGAPKLSAMRIIRSLEPTPRGVYCGALGLVRPGGSAIFNVPIRTVTMSSEQLVCGIGSGVVIDARAQEEWREWRNKRAFLIRACAPFKILETLGLRDGKMDAAERHLDRMASATGHFGYRFDRDEAQRELEKLKRSHSKGAWRIRLLLDASGTFQAQAYALPPSPPNVRLQLAPRPLEEADTEFVRYKTTRREHYEALAPTGSDIFDTILWNENGEVTECTRGNLAFLQDDGRWITPAAACGLLPGVERARLLETGRIVEGVIHVDDLHRLRGVAFINSLRGWIDATLVDRMAGTKHTT